MALNGSALNVRAINAGDAVAAPSPITYGPSWLTGVTVTAPRFTNVDLDPE